MINTACERGESSWERKTRSTRGDRNRSYSSERRQGKMKKSLGMWGERRRVTEKKQLLGNRQS